MEAMHCLRMPHGPAGGPDCPHSSSSRRNPLLRRHLAFPKGGAKVAAAPRWTVRAQAPAPPSQPEGEDANPKGRLGGWHRTRGAAVGAAVVLACALGAACLNRRGGAYCCTQDRTTTAQATQPAPRGGYASLPPAEKSVCVLSSIFKPRAAAPKERSMLLQHAIEEIKDEVTSLGLQPERVRLLRSLVEHLHDELVEDYYCWEALRREYATTDSLYEEWGRLQDDERKYKLGLLLIEIFIRKRDYDKALDICKREFKLRYGLDGRKDDDLLWDKFLSDGRYGVEGCKDDKHLWDEVLSDGRSSPSDTRPYLYLAIIEMMLAVESMLKPITTDEKLKKTIEETTETTMDNASKAWKKFHHGALNLPPNVD